MMVSLLFGNFKDQRRSTRILSRISALIFLLLLVFAGCEGEPGYPGPTGPAGGTINLDIELAANPLAIRVGEDKSVTITATARLVDGADVVNVPVSFQVSTGGGICLPILCETDNQGRAETQYTASSTTGVIDVSAVVEYQGISIARTIQIDQFPAGISDPLLPTSRSWGSPGRWDPNSGSIVMYETYVGLMYSISPGGISSDYILVDGGLRGGYPNPNGSGEILFNDFSVQVLDIHGEVQFVLDEPANFDGSIINARWCMDGAKILLVSNSTEDDERSYAVVDPNTGDYTKLTANDNLAVVSAIPYSTDMLMIRNRQTLMRFNLETGEVTPLFPLDVVEQPFSSFYESNISVAPDGQNLVTASDGNLWIVNIADGSWLKIFDGSFGISNPAFSPDGTRILFNSRRMIEETNLYIFDLSKEAARR